MGYHSGEPRPKKECGKDRDDICRIHGWFDYKEPKCRYYRPEAIPTPAQSSWEERLRNEIQNELPRVFVQDAEDDIVRLFRDLLLSQPPAPKECCDYCRGEKERCDKCYCHTEAAKAHKYRVSKDCPHAFRPAWDNGKPKICAECTHTPPEKGEDWAEEFTDLVFNRQYSCWKTPLDLQDVIDFISKWRTLWQAEARREVKEEFRTALNLFADRVGWDVEKAEKEIEKIIDSLQSDKQ